MEQPKSEEVPTTVPEAAPAAPSTPAAKPGPTKKTWLIVAVVALVAVVVIAAVVLGTGMLDSDDGDDGDDGIDEPTTWVPQPGDFVEYSMHDSIGNSMTMKYVIVSVTETNKTINVTISSQYGSFSDELIVPMNQTFGGDYDMDELPSDVTMTDHGMQSISTKWGSKSAHHYTIVENSEPVTSDMWIKNGVLLKVEQEAYGGSSTLTLTDTNIDAITG